MATAFKIEVIEPLIVRTIEEKDLIITEGYHTLDNVRFNNVTDTITFFWNQMPCVIKQTHFKKLQPYQIIQDLYWSDDGGMVNYDIESTRDEFDRILLNIEQNN